MSELDAFSNMVPETVERVMAARRGEAGGAGSSITGLRDLDERLRMLNKFLAAGEHKPEEVKLQRAKVPERDKKERKPWVKKTAAVGDVVANILTLLGNKQERKRAGRVGSPYRPDYRTPSGPAISTAVKKADLDRQGRVEAVDELNRATANQEAVFNAGQAATAAGKQASGRNAMLPSLASALFRQEPQDPGQLQVFERRLQEIQDMPDGPAKNIALMSLLANVQPNDLTRRGGSTKPSPGDPGYEEYLRRIQDESHARARGSRSGKPWNPAEFWEDQYQKYMQYGEYLPDEAARKARQDTEFRIKIQNSYSEQSGERTVNPTSEALRELEADPGLSNRIRNLAERIKLDPSNSDAYRKGFQDRFGKDPVPYLDALKQQLLQ